jgi:NADH-quinone oxidoreductase subunit L
MSKALYTGMEKSGINALVDGIGDTVVGMGGLLRLAQTGNVGFYMLVMAVGLMVVLAVSLFVH